MPLCHNKPIKSSMVRLEWPMVKTSSGVIRIFRGGDARILAWTSTAWRAYETSYSFLLMKMRLVP